MLSERDWWMTEYVVDIFQILRQREIRVSKLMGNSPQLHKRAKLVDWLIRAGRDLKLRKTAVYLSVYLLDHYMDCHDLRECHLVFVAASCLLIAAKFEDNDRYAPRISQLNQMIPKYNYTIKEFIRMELAILKFFDWCIMVPTVPHFIDYFSTEAICCQDLNYSEFSSATNSLLKKEMLYYIDYFMELSLQDLIYTRFDPSVIAASCVASSRIYLMLSPRWTVNLETITGYAWSQLQSCIEIMMRTVAYDGQLKDHKLWTRQD